MPGPHRDPPQNQTSGEFRALRRHILNRRLDAIMQCRSRMSQKEWMDLLRSTDENNATLLGISLGLSTTEVAKYLLSCGAQETVFLGDDSMTLRCTLSEPFRKASGIAIPAPGASLIPRFPASVTSFRSNALDAALEMYVRGLSDTKASESGRSSGNSHADPRAAVADPPAPGTDPLIPPAPGILFEVGDIVRLRQGVLQSSVQISYDLTSNIMLSNHCLGSNPNQLGMIVRKMISAPGAQWNEQKSISSTLLVAAADR